MGRSLAPNHAEGVYISSDRRSGYHQAAGGCTLARDEIQGLLAALQLADKVYFKNGSCCFAQIKFYKKDSATEQRAPSGRELSSEARLKEPAGDYATIFDKDVAFDARGLLPPPTVVPLPPGGRPYYHRLCTFCQIQLKDTTLSSA